MTIDKLLGYTSAELEALDKSGKLEEILQPYLKVTRPELAEKPSSTGGRIRSMTESVSDQKRSKLERAAQIAQQFGFDDLL